MSSPCTVPKLVRWRVRNLASCFHACRIPLGERPNGAPPETAGGSMVLDSRRVQRGHRMSAKTCDEAVGGESVEGTSSLNKMSKSGHHHHEPRFAEEDYIVFCFREDGAIHMINEPNSSSSSQQQQPYDGDNNHQHSDTTTTNTAIIPLKPINRKLQYGERGGLTSDAKEMKSGDWVRDGEIKEIKTVNEQQQQQHPNIGSKKESSFESCDSNVSDTSTSSFAFPVLGIEWIGSPVHMPKSENHEPPSTLCPHCCRF